MGAVLDSDSMQLYIKKYASILNLLLLDFYVSVSLYRRFCIVKQKLITII